MIKPRARIQACYDHLGGIAGERLTHWFIAVGWVTPEPAPGVTPLGWTGFATLGLDLTPLMGGRRKPVAYCSERPGDAAHEHLGGHLGALLRRHFLSQGWLAFADGTLTLTPEGEQLLQNLGVNLEETE